MATPQRNVSRGKGPAKPAPRAAAPARKPAAASNGHAADEPAPLSGSFADLLEQAINAVPEEPELEPGDFRFRVKSVGPNKKQDRIMFVLQAIEDLSGAMEGVDLAACRPVFMNFDPTRAGDMRQLNEIAAAAGIDVEMSKREMIEKKAFNGIELVGSVTKSDPAARDDGRVFTNVRGLRFPD